LAHHVEHIALRSPTEAAWRALLSRLVSTPLDRRRPLWHVNLVDRPDAGTTIVFRVHHAIADGFSLLDVLGTLCDGRRIARQRPARAAQPRAHRPLAAAGALERIVTLPDDPPTVLRTPLAGEKRVAWSAPLSLAELKQAARAARATVNDVLVATTAGALGRYLTSKGERRDGLELHALIPVNLRPPVSLAAPPENDFGLVIAGLPICMGDPMARIGAVKRRMNALKGSPEAKVTRAVLEALGRAPPSVEGRVAEFFGAKASLVLTNVPGPRVRLELAGIPISRMMFWVPAAAHLGLGISILSYAGDVTLGVLSDAAVVPDPEVLVADLETELAALLDEASGDQTRLTRQSGQAR
jgi:WS/DGAT/MGAT family acyltransferase